MLEVQKIRLFAADYWMYVSPAQCCLLQFRQTIWSAVHSEASLKEIRLTAFLDYPARASKLD